MGEDKILVAPDNEVTGKTSSAVLVFSLFLLFLVPGCGMPRIIVLDDSLTPEEHLNLGVAYENKGELDAAAREYRAAAKSLPEGYLYLGNISFRKGEYEEAEDYYRKTIEKDPANADAYNNLAWLFYTEGRNLQEAEDLALRAAELNPAKADVYYDTIEKIRAMKDIR